MNADPRRRTTVVRAAIALAAALCLTACRPPAPAPSATTLPAVKTDSPLAAARSLLELLEAQLAAVARHDRAGAAGARDRVVTELLARDNLLERARRAPRGAVSDEALLAELVENWAAVIAYYTGGFDYERAAVRYDREGERGGAEIQATAHGDTTLVRVACVRNSRGTWEVVGLSLEPVAATPPATASAPAVANPPGAANPPVAADEPAVGSPPATEPGDR